MGFNSAFKGLIYFWKFTSISNLKLYQAVGLTVTIIGFYSFLMNFEWYFRCSDPNDDITVKLYEVDSTILSLSKLRTSNCYWVLVKTTLGRKWRDLKLHVRGCKVCLKILTDYLCTVFSYSIVCHGRLDMARDVMESDLVHGSYRASTLCCWKVNCK